MQKIPLTERAVRQAGIKNGARQVYSIEGVPHLKLFANADGSKTYAVKINYEGQTRRAVIGHPTGFAPSASQYPLLTCRQVRNLAPQAVNELRTTRRSFAVPQKAGNVTFSDVLDEYAAVVLIDKPSGTAIEQVIRDVFAKLMHRPLDEIKLADLQQAVNARNVAGTRKAEGAPVMANRSIGCVRPFFGWAKKTYGLDINPAKELEKVAEEKPRDRVLNDAEIAAIWEAAGKMPYPYGPLVKVLLLTAVRKSEAAQMRREELELEKGLWTIPAARTGRKNGKARTIPLSAVAVEVLRQAIKQSPDAELVFCYSPGRYMNNFKPEKRRLDAISGVSDWTIHDIRTAIATGLAELGVDELICDRVLNHQASATRSIIHRAYQKTEALEPRRVALETWADHVLSLVGEGPKGDNVERLRA